MGRDAVHLHLKKKLAKVQEKEKYLGDIIHSNGQNHAAFVEK